LGHHQKSAIILFRAFRVTGKKRKTGSMVSAEKKRFIILASVVSVAIVAAWLIGGRKPREGGELGAGVVFVAIAALGVFLEKQKFFTTLPPSIIMGLK
jgi:hypothetical protein